MARTLDLQRPGANCPSPILGLVRSTAPGCLPGSSLIGPKWALPDGSQKVLASPSGRPSTAPVCSLESPSLAPGPLHPHSLGLRTLLPWLQHLPPSRHLSATAALQLSAQSSSTTVTTPHKLRHIYRLPPVEGEHEQGCHQLLQLCWEHCGSSVNTCQVNEHAENTRLSSRGTEAHLSGLNHKRSWCWDHGANVTAPGSRVRWGWECV